MWCHLLLAMPAIGLSLFFLLPFSTALALYLLIVLLSAGFYYKITESMNTHLTTGRADLWGVVVMTDANSAVQWQGEWWTVEPYLPKQHVRIIARRGLHLLVEPMSGQTDNFSANR